MAVNRLEIERNDADRSLSISLGDASLLKATTPAIVLGKCGSTLQTTAGGSSVVSDSEQADLAYQKSFTVTELDAFLSHSWHGPWKLKYLTLLFYFNMNPAVFMAFLAAIATFIIRRWVTPLDTVDASRGLNVNNKGVCLKIGAVCFLAVLLTWHHIAGRLPFLGSKIFLDKMCIHQTNLQKKTLGIQNIGAYLAASKVMLVVWDETYFERLWCVFEMSAFLHARPNGRITMLPAIVGKVVFSMLAMSFMNEIFVTTVVQSLAISDDWTNQFAFFVFSTALDTWLAGRFRQYFQLREVLDQRLKNFKADDAKCFCCSNAHTHPESGGVIPCDRKLVYASIAKWYDPDGKDMDQSMQIFDNTVHCAFRQAVIKTLGVPRQLPYAIALTRGLSGALSWLDFSRGQSLYWATLMVSNELFLTSPFSVAMLARTTSLLSSNVCSDLVVAIINNCIFNSFWGLFVQKLLPRCDSLTFVWILFEVVTVIFLYRHQR